MAFFILDAGALLNSKFEFSQKHRYACPSGVFDEWKSFSQKLLAENAFSSGVLQIIDPCPWSIEKVQKKALETGTKRLSPTDLAVIALALESKERRQRPIVLTDDFGVQNVLKHLKLRFQGVLRGEIKTAKVFAKTPKNPIKH